ncbi:MAG: SpoVG family protein [Ruminococcus sp.]|nr:SpoVG family protein [Ruminococcus sp.]MCM1481003.1 SpoVG family protein [Muribaculaceae bacterium]
MQVTDIKIRKVFDEKIYGGTLRAVMSITLDDCLAIHDVKIIQGYDRLFVGMPSKKYDHYGFRDVVHPISQDVRKNLERIVLEAYNDYVAEFQP